MEILYGVLTAWLGVLTWKVWGYRGAVIRLQREISEDGGILDELTRPARGGSDVAD